MKLMKLMRLIYMVLFRGFAGPSAICGTVGKWQEENPNMGYN
jgi:hypothetical protein